MRGALQVALISKHSTWPCCVCVWQCTNVCISRSNKCVFQEWPECSDSPLGFQRKEEKAHLKMLLLTVCTHWCLRDIQERKQDVNHLVTRRGEKVVAFSYLLSDTIASSCCDQLVAQRVNVCRGCLNGDNMSSNNCGPTQTDCNRSHTDWSIFANNCGLLYKCTQIVNTL